MTNQSSVLAVSADQRQSYRLVDLQVLLGPQLLHVLLLELELDLSALEVQGTLSLAAVL